MTSTFHVRGGRPLDGEITVRGAKNLVSKAMVAALLGESPPSILHSVPDIRDVQIVSQLLSIHGVKVERDVAGGTIRMDPSNVERAHATEIDAHAGSSRIPILFCGPLLHRLGGEAIIPDLGGCRIGDRPINYHLDVLRKFGAVVDKREMGISITAPNGLTGTRIHLEYPSVGATEQVLLTAVRAQGITELSNAAVEPEIEDLIAVLQKMGGAHHPADRSHHHDRRGGGAPRRLRARGHPRPDRGRLLGVRGAGHPGIGVHPGARSRSRWRRS